MAVVKWLLFAAAWSLTTTALVMATAQPGGPEEIQNEMGAGGAEGAPDPEGGEGPDVPVLAPEPPPPPPPPAPVLGGRGESCRARADCEPDLRCIANVCRHQQDGGACSSDAECGPLQCHNGLCRDPNVTRPADDGDVWRPRLGEPGVAGIVGLHLAGGPGAGFDLAREDIGDAAGMLVFSARGGVLIERFEGTLELGLDVFQFSADPVFLMGLNAGYYLPLYASEDTDLSWPFRVGAGFVAGEGLDPIFQMRADLIGIAFNRGPLLLEAHFPSFRFVSDFEDSPRRVRITIFQWLFGASASYVF